MAQPITPINSVSLFAHLFVNVTVFIVKTIKNLSAKRNAFIYLILLSLIAFVVGAFASIRLLNSNLNLTSFSELVPTSQPTKRVTPPSQIGVWIAYWDESASIKSLIQADSEIKIISPIWYRLDSEGGLINTTYSHKEEVLSVASESAVLIMPTINNEYEGGFDPERVSKILNDKSKSDELIKELLEKATEENYHGWDIDWEQVKSTDKESFTNFVKKLAEALHSEGYRLSVTVHSQTGSSDNWVGSKGQDLKELAKYVDEIRVMAYDFHNSISLPGPVTPPDKLNEVLEFTVKNIPLDKLIIGLPLYGYDWVGNKGESVQYLEAINTIESNLVNYNRDEISKELTAKYVKEGIEHEVWFQDSESVGEKIALAREHGVFKFFFWRLGNEDPNTWLTYRNYK